MVTIDFDGDGCVADYLTVPAGVYLCRIAETQPGTTRAGDERWAMRLVVAEGQHIGKQAAWDGLVFSPRGLARVRLIFRAVGLPAEGRVSVDAIDLHGRVALVEIRRAEYVTPGGTTVRRNEVPYEGWRSATEKRKP
jgi:hypothetical protein